MFYVRPASLTGNLRGGYYTILGYVILTLSVNEDGLAAKTGLTLHFSVALMDMLV